MREFVTIDVSVTHPQVGTLLLTREPTNALTRQVCSELASAARELAERTDIAAVIFFGGHDIFSTGNDHAQLCTFTRAQAQAADQGQQEAMDALAAIAQPTVAAITGYALGSGLTMALTADWRVSGDNVRLGFPDISTGVIPGGGGCARLVDTVGRSRAKELVFSAGMVDAQQALEWGLVDEVVGPDEVYTRALAWAARFVDTDPVALAAAKSLLNGALESDAQRHCYGTAFAPSQTYPGGR